MASDVSEEHKLLRSLRFEIQRVFLSPRHPIREADMYTMNDLFEALEGYDIDVDGFAYSKIGKVLRLIHSLPDGKIPQACEDEYRFRRRALGLRNKWHKAVCYKRFQAQAQASDESTTIHMSDEEGTRVAAEQEAMNGLGGLRWARMGRMCVWKGLLEAVFFGPDGLADSEKHVRQIDTAFASMEMDEYWRLASYNNVLRELEIDQILHKISSLSDGIIPPVFEDAYAFRHRARRLLIRWNLGNVNMNTDPRSSSDGEATETHEDRKGEQMDLISEVLKLQLGS